MQFVLPRINNTSPSFRDWMKRLNIKSVFTHHSQNQQPQQDQEEQQLQENKSGEAAPSDNGKCEEEKSNGGSSSNVAFPGMVQTPPSLADIAANEDGGDRNENAGKTEKVVEEEEEIDDDEEEHSLKIDE